MKSFLLSILKAALRFGRKIRTAYWTNFVKLRLGGYEGRLLVNGPSSLTRNTFLGKNTNFNGLTISGGGKVTIGSYFHSGPECMFICQNHNFNTGTAIPYDNTYVNKDITIGDCVWLGSRVIVLGGVTIGEGAIIHAGSCVVNDIPAYAIAGGHPAKVFAYRDKEHYSKLKDEGKFN